MGSRRRGGTFREYKVPAPTGIRADGTPCLARSRVDFRETHLARPRASQDRDGAGRLSVLSPPVAVDPLIAEAKDAAPASAACRRCSGRRGRSGECHPHLAHVGELPRRLRVPAFRLPRTDSDQRRARPSYRRAHEFPFRTDGLPLRALRSPPSLPVRWRPRGRQRRRSGEGRPQLRSASRPPPQFQRDRGSDTGAVKRSSTSPHTVGVLRAEVEVGALTPATVAAANAALSGCSDVLGMSV